MKTRQQIKEKSLELFNTNGVMHVTLRRVAEELNRSYGNITYYYSTKEKLVTEHYRDMISQLAEIGGRFLNENTRLEDLLTAPGATFDLSMEYVFLWKDYLEILRSYPDLRAEVEANNQKRMMYYLSVLKRLQDEGYLRNDLDDDDIHFLMEASGALRIQFFYLLKPGEKTTESLKEDFQNGINRLLKPYLTEKGRTIYDSLT